MNRGIPTRDQYLRPTRAARRRRRQLRPTLNLLEDRLLLAVAPQTYDVTNLNDSGPGSLRDAIASANADSYSGFAFDTIEFDPSLTAQTIDLTTIGDSTDDGNSALAIKDPILIDGSAAPGLTIARSSAVGTPDFRIFYVASVGNLELNALTISGGQDLSGYGGGGLLNYGRVTLTGDTFIANFAIYGGGLDNGGGTATLTGDTFMGNSATEGGGVYNGATATLMGDNFTDNSATGVFGGGGLDNDGTAMLTSDSDTFTGNSAPQGGGLDNDGGSAKLTGDTFTDNSATIFGGGLANLEGTAMLTSDNDSFTGNSATDDGGGLFNYVATATLTGDSFTGNSAPEGGGLYNDDGAPTLMGDTFSGNTATNGGGLFSDGGTPTVTGDIFTGNSASYDGGGLDNGGGFATLTGDTFTGNSALNQGGGLYNGTTVTVTVTNDTFTGNSAAGVFGGGGLCNEGGTATLTGDTFTDNSTASVLGGGGLSNVGGTVTLSDDTFTDNSASLAGGGLLNVPAGPVPASATLTNDTFADNSATDGGGLCNLDNATVTLTNDTFTDNSAAQGGGLENDDGVAMLYNTIVAGNYIAGSSYSTMPSEISGTVSGSNNLIGDPHSAGGLTNGSFGNIVGIGGTSPIPLSTIFATDTNGVPLLANYGGLTQTVALVPGSPAIDGGSTSVPDYMTTDQRGLPRVGAPDIGAFESQGFQLTISGGNGQATPVDQPFASPLTVTITANNPLEPVNGGRILFDAFLGTDPGFDPSATISGSPATIAGGTASATATANNIPGIAEVFALDSEAGSVEFMLFNQQFTPANIQAEINAAGPGGITLQPTTLDPLSVILTTLASLGPQASTAKVTVSLPSTMSPYQAITVNLPAGLNFTLNGNGSSVNGNVTISQPGGVDTTVNNLDVTGNLQIQAGNAANSLAVVTQSNVIGNVQVQAGNGSSDSLSISGLSVSGNAQFQSGNGNSDRILVSGLTLSGNGNAQIQTGNGTADSISADALVVGGNLQIQTGNGDGDSVAVTAVSGPTTITGTTQIQLGNGAGDTATVNGPAGATFNGSFTLQMGNGGNTVNIGTVAGNVTFGGTVQVQFGHGSNNLNLAATITRSGGVPGSQVYFKKQAVFDGKNTRYVGASGVNVFGTPVFNN